MFSALILSQQVAKAFCIRSYTWRFEQLSRRPFPPQPDLSLSLAQADTLGSGISVSLATCLRTLLFSYSFCPFLWELVHLST